jgi:hypothetical protein
LSICAGARAGRVRNFVAIAAFPPRDFLIKAPREGRIRLLAGGEETWGANGPLAETGALLRRHTPNYPSHLIPGEGHFFMLNAEAETKAILQGWGNALDAAKN